MSLSIVTNWLLVKLQTKVTQRLCKDKKIVKVRGFCSGNHTIELTEIARRN
jgi:hypothetical protein